MAAVQYCLAGCPGGRKGVVPQCINRPATIPDQEVPEETVESTSFGLGENTESALAYSLWFVTGIFFLLMEDANRTVRFHALQSILVSLTLVIVVFVIRFIPTAVWLILPVQLAGIVLWIVLVITAYQERKISIPLISAIAESRA